MNNLSPTGCPISSRAADFDPFEGAFQIDPALALRWSREQEPVFYSPRLGYWVVSRYADVKEVFRNNKVFSPSIALEKITPVSQEAQDVLKSYDYAMNRTLVNEDEPAHMPRRRALMFSFSPAELAHHEPMVRRLTSEYIDGFIHKGKADLVDEMLYEIPLTVALHFLGIPEEDMETLRAYSAAHIVNTWGKPSKDRQVEIAHLVGKFWQYSGKVLEKMRQDPSGHGWMRYSLRQQQELPKVVTDSYLHSMMMAGLVAAHETTAHSMANAMRALLSNIAVWQEICDNSMLIPNAIEECLRAVGSISAWRRIATEDTIIGGIKIPKGAKLLIATASANHDLRHFENPDELDIYRDNTTDHLTFGYGSHQCLGKNLARMEMRIFLEEFTRRLPHMRLMENQEFTYLPNTSFRGPHHVWVEWNPAENPEDKTPEILRQRKTFAIGAPARADIAHRVSVSAITEEATGVVRLVLKDAGGRDLPKWTAGAHIDLLFENYERKYSLCGNPQNRTCYEVAVLKEEQGRGGSYYIHEIMRPGMDAQMRGPKNHFRLEENAAHYILIAGGIGITPIMAMAGHLQQLGKSYALHYAGRAFESMAFAKYLQRVHGQALRLYPKAAGKRLDLAKIINGDGEIYACGPERLLTSLEGMVTDERLHSEHFSAIKTWPNSANDRAFLVELQDSNLNLEVSQDQTLLQALRRAGIDVPSDCEEGLCGSCEVGVLAGEINHRDRVLNQTEKSAHNRMMSCCSRAKTDKLVLAL